MIDYKILNLYSPIDIGQLSKLGQEGWMLVSVVTSGYWETGVIIYYFSRSPLVGVKQEPEYHGEGTA